jgi:hypothetical protein
MLKKWTVLLAFTGGCLLFASAPMQAQKEKKVESTKEEIQQERMQKLLTAYDLAAQGRKKNAPEYLITAAGLLRQLSTIKDMQDMKKLDVKVKIEGDKKADLVDQEIAAPSLAQQSDDLFKEASDMGATLGVNVDKLIKLAKERESSDKEERAVVGGPKQISRLIGPGQTQSFHITIRARAQTAFGFGASFPMRVTVVHEGTGSGDGSVWVDGVAVQVQRMFLPNSECKLTIRVQNLSKLKGQYQMFIN